jgi:ATP-dependent helicase/nuclease subunit B
MHRTFLDWNDIPLARAAEWLAVHFDGDLSGVLVALPGARAGRILGERLALIVGPELRPPTIVTSGRLTDELLEIDGVGAGQLVRTAAWEKALRELEESALRRIVARPPESQDRGGWNRLAEEVRTLFGEIAAEDLDFAKVANSPELSPEEGERARWAALARAQGGMRAILESVGMVDPHLGRIEAIDKRRVKKVRQVVLVGVTEMNELLRKALELCEAEQTALVFAPEELKSAFDELGCILPAKWIERGSSLSLEQWHVVDGPDDQARRCVEAIGGWKGEYSAEQITIGLADAEVTPFLQGRLAEQGGLARDAAGTPFARTSPALLLEAVSAILDGRRFVDLATLVRHPAFERALRLREHGIDPAAIVDAYHNAHLPGKIDERWLSREKWDRGLREEMKGLWDATRDLLGELARGEETPTAERIGQLRSFLEQVYGGRELDPNVEEDRTLSASLRLVGEGLAEVEELPAELAPPGSTTEVIDTLLGARRSTSVPPPPPAQGEPTIELLGWLELALDDAPALVVTGFEDGRVPESKRGDAFLPNRLREKLFLTDDSKRLARDLFATELIVHSRREAVFITGRRSLGGEPQVPSRIIFHCEAEELLPRVKRFVEGGQAAPRPILSGDDIKRELPRRELEAPPEEMRVTDFRLFLNSPYEYYLRRVLKLDTLDDTAREIDAGGFGNLAHSVLQRFGENAKVKGSRDMETIEAFLIGELHTLAAQTYGKNPLPAVRLQVEQLAGRLSVFAKQQAARRREGWEIVETEWAPEAQYVELDVDGETMRIRGRIDRIDRHPEKGWAIWDYKTGETADKPENAHRTMKGEWKDLQLPLYCLLAQELVAGGESPTLGYFTLCRELDTIGFKEVPAGWRKSDSFDDTEEGITDGIETAQEVIRAIRRGEFFTSEGFKPYEEIFSAIGGVGLVGVDEEEGE